ncbi:MAG: outer membrane lipoprotein-sorting protein [Pseudomonadales bacterium]|nr:outer membrane lipoprotein-sorting protein [Pseudomonadales bacterium]
MKSVWLALGLALFLVSILAPTPTTAATEAEAVALVKKIDELYRSRSSQSTMTMEIVTPNWQRTLALEAWTRGMDDTFIRVLSPKKDRGVATLKLDREMWNYFPKINKVIKVPPSMMMGSWMGSDFTNDDLVREVSLVEEYHVTLDSSGEHHVLTLVPKAQTVTVWAKIVISVTKDTSLPVEETFFNEKGEAVRVMTFTEIKTFSGREMPSVMTMTPLNKSGHKTVVRYEQLQLDVSVEDDIFTLRNLQKRFR